MVAYFSLPKGKNISDATVSESKKLACCSRSRSHCYDHRSLTHSHRICRSRTYTQRCHSFRSRTHNPIHIRSRSLSSVDWVCRNPSHSPSPRTCSLKCRRSDLTQGRRCSDQHCCTMASRKWNSAATWSLPHSFRSCRSEMWHRHRVGRSRSSWTSSLH